MTWIELLNSLNWKNYTKSLVVYHFSFHLDELSWDFAKKSSGRNWQLLYFEVCWNWPGKSPTKGVSVIFDANYISVLCAAEQESCLAVLDDGSSPKHVQDMFTALNWRRRPWAFPSWKLTFFSCRFYILSSLYEIFLKLKGGAFSRLKIKNESKVMKLFRPKGWVGSIPIKSQLQRKRLRKSICLFTAPTNICYSALTPMIKLFYFQLDVI